MLRPSVAAPLLLGALLGLAAPPAGATSYSLTRFAPPPGTTDFIGGGAGAGGNKFNNAGQIIGQATGGVATSPTGFLRNANGVYEQIGGTTYGATVTPYALNASGQVVGTSALGGCCNHAVRWGSGGTVQDLGTGGGSNLYSRAYAINAAGTVVGYSSGASDANSQVLLWSASGTVQNLGIAGQAMSINGPGQVAGNTSDGRAFLWSSGSSPQYLSAPAGYDSARVTGINDLGQVIGSFYNEISENYVAFVWSGGVSYTKLGGNSYLDYTRATSINNNGQVLLNSDNLNGGFGDFIWTQATGAQLIDNPATAANGWTQVSLTSINDLGQILGFGIYNGVRQAFLLSQTDVPAPAGLAVFASGLLGLGFALRRRAGAGRAGAVGPGFAL
jgi:probable HAF family extracellular repeat protein